MNYRALSSRVLPVLLIATFASIALPTTAQSQYLPARLFASDYSIRLGADGPVRWCVNAEPINNEWVVTDVNVNTLIMISEGTGSVSQINADSRNVIAGDGDGNGIQDIRLCFFKSDLQALFSTFHGKKPKNATVTIRGSLYSGGTFSAQVGVSVYPQ